MDDRVAVQSRNIGAKHADDRCQLNQQRSRLERHRDLHGRDAGLGKRHHLHCQWWTQGADPASNNGVKGTGEPWTATGKVNTAPTAPNAPTGLTATAVSSSEIDLSWTAATVSGSGTVSEYVIFENGQQIATTTKTSYDVTSLAASSTYKFSVEAVDATGASPQSSAVSATTTATPTAPNAPTKLTATAVSSSEIGLSWTAATVSGSGTVSDYLVFENGQQIATTTKTSYDATSLAASTTYKFSVEAVDATGASPQSSAVPATTTSSSPSTGNVAAWSASAVYTAGMDASENGIIYTANWWTQGADPVSNSGATGTGEPWTAIGKVNTAPTAPDAPSGLAATAISSSTVYLSWNAATVSGSGTVSNYVIFENGQQIATTANTYYDVSSLAASTTYKFSVEAVDATGASPQSTTVPATTPAAGTTTSSAVFSPYIDMKFTGPRASSRSRRPRGSSISPSPSFKARGRGPSVGPGPAQSPTTRCRTVRQSSPKSMRCAQSVAMSRSRLAGPPVRIPRSQPPPAASAQPNCKPNISQ